jgi:pimeloyl-ACP methyl ester carboxylesterase
MASALLYRRDRPTHALRARYATEGSRFIRLRGGVTMHVRDEGPRDAPVVVLCHGMVGDMAMWDATAEALRQHYRVVRCDWPGHGLTVAPDDFEPTVQRCVELVRDLLDALGIHRVVLVGQSLGGDVAWRYVLAEPSHVAALVLVDASGWNDRRMAYRAAALALPVLRLRVAQRLLGRLDPGPFVYLASRITSFPDRIPRGAVKRYRALMLHPGHRTLMARWLGGWNARSKASRHALSQIGCPTLVVHGALDLAVPVVDATAFASTVGRSELHVVRHAGHLTPMTHPRRLARIIQRWIERTCRAAARA